MDSLNITGYGSLNQAYAASAASPDSSTTSSSKKSSSSALDMSDFLKLMAAQFQSQSLDSNVDNTQYITELAQFSAIQAMTTLTQNFNRQYAASLVGKIVTANTGVDSNPTVTGIVQGAVYGTDGSSKVVIGGNAYDVSDVTQTATDNSETMLALREYASSLIGYTVTVNTGDTESPAVTGVVESAVYDTDGSCMITINGNKYNPADVTNVEFRTSET